MKVSVPEHSKISPTAKLVAYWRKFSDVPFASEVAELIRAEEVSKELFKSTDFSLDKMTWFAPMIEARYKSMVSAIQKYKIKQVLELASGVALRGLSMTMDSEMIYVETDLPGMSSEKKWVVQKIQEGLNIPKRSNLFFHDVNVLNESELEVAAGSFVEGRPIAIIHEGLFQYLSFKEKEMAAKHFKSLLKKFGGIWMTPDFSTLEDIDRHWSRSPTSKESSLDTINPMMDQIQKLTLRDFRDCAFRDENHIREFTEKLGFEIEEVPQIDNTYELTSVKRLNISEEVLRSYSASLKIWVMRLRSDHE